MTTDLSTAPSMVLNQANLSEACLDDLQKYFWTRSIGFCRRNGRMIHLNAYSRDVICRSFRVHASSRLIQVEALSARNHPAQCPLVLPLRLKLSGLRRNDGGVWFVG